jgi:predicted dehydrogenase
LEAVTRIGLVGLGAWGQNLVRNFDELAEVPWLCDTSVETRIVFERRYPQARTTGDFGDLLTDPDVDAVVIATPVPSHFPLAKQAIAAGKHVFVEKPPAMRGHEMEELCSLAMERDRVLMPGHLLLYHPAVRKLKAVIDSGELGEIFYAYSDRLNLGVVRRVENALLSLGVHDLSVLLYLFDEEPGEVRAFGKGYLNPEVEDVVLCHLRFPSGRTANMRLSWLDPHKVRRITVVGREKMAVFDDMDLDRKITVYDKTAEQASGTYGEWQTRTGDIFSPKIPNDEPLRLECEHFLRLVREGPGDYKEARDGLMVVRALEQLQDSLSAVPA